MASVEHHIGKRIDVELPSERAIRERLDARVTAAPPHGVSRRSQEAGALDRIADANRVEQLPATRWNDTASPRLTGGRVISRTSWPHFASKQRRGGAGRPAAENHDSGNACHLESDVRT